MKIPNESIQKLHRRVALLAAAGCSLFTQSADAATLSAEWVGDGSVNFSNGNWSNPTLWSPAGVPNNGGGDVYDVVLRWDENGQQFNGPQLDINVTIQNLTLVNRAFLDNQAFPGTDLTVTGTTSITTDPGREGETAAIFTTGDFILGTLANYTPATKTLESGSLFPFNGGTIQFRNADIVTNRGTLVVGDGSEILDQNSGLRAYRNLAVNYGGFNLGGGHNFTTVGDLTNFGLLAMSGNGTFTSVFTVGGNFTNFDPQTFTLSGGTDLVVESDAGPGTATFRFAGADIRTVAGTTVRVKGPGAAITDLNGNNALRNLQFLNNATFSISGLQTITPSGLSGETLVALDSVHTIENGADVVIDGNYQATGGQTNIGTPGGEGDTRFTVNGTALFVNASLDMGGQPGVNTLYFTELEVINGLEFRGAFLTGTGTILADILLTQGSTLSPGRSPGQLNMVGELTLDVGTSSIFEIGGLLPGEDFDWVNHTGPADLTLGGVLYVSLIDGFENAISSTDIFEIITSENTLLGEFENVTGGARLQTLDGLGSFLVTYQDDTRVVLSDFVPVPEPATLVLLGSALLFACGRRRRTARA